MIVINTVNDGVFTHNGIPYFKNFTPYVIGSRLKIVNTYNNCIVLNDFLAVDQFIVDGVTFTEIEDLQTALLPVISISVSGGGTGGSSDFVEKQFYAIKPITTETFTLTNDGSTTFLLDTPTFGGFNFSNANTVKLFNGKTFTLANFTDEPITLLAGFAGATIKFPNEIVIPAGVSLRFFVQFVQTIIDDETIFVSYRLNLIGAVGGGGGGTTIHNELTGRDADDAHPISAITGLEDELDAKLETVDTNDIVNHAVTNTKLAQMNANTVKGRLSGNGTPQDIPMADLPISTATQTALDNRQLLARVSDTATANFNLSSKTWNNREVFLVVDVNDITVTLDVEVDTVLIRKIGSKSITFVNGSGRTIAFLSGIDTAESNYVSVIIQSVGTVDLLQINEDVDLFVRKSDFFTIEVLASAFTGTPRKATVTLPNGGLGTTNYDILPQIYSAQNNWHIENKTGTSFVFGFNSGDEITANVEFTIRKR
jgi:hypothetical protein